MWYWLAYVGALIYCLRTVASKYLNNKSNPSKPIVYDVYTVHMFISYSWLSQEDWGLVYLLRSRSAQHKMLGLRINMGRFQFSFWLVWEEVAAVSNNLAATALPYGGGSRGNCCTRNNAVKLTQTALKALRLVGSDRSWPLLRILLSTFYTDTSFVDLGLTEIIE